MKLHLPKMLRKAVIACMAAVTGISTTVATGTLLVSMMTQQAQAALTASEDGKVVTYANADNSKIELNTLNAAYPALEKVVFDMSDSGSSNWLENTGGLEGLIQIGNDYTDGSTGLILNNGGGATYEIANKVTGAGMIKKTGYGVLQISQQVP